MELDAAITGCMLSTDFTRWRAIRAAASRLGSGCRDRLV